MINPVGSQIYINQNMHVAAAKIGGRLGSAEYSQLANQMTSQEKVQEIQEISPIEKNAKINPDREHQKHHNQDEQEAEEKSKQHKELQEPGSNPLIRKYLAGIQYPLRIKGLFDPGHQFNPWPRDFHMEKPGLSHSYAMLPGYGPSHVNDPSEQCPDSFKYVRIHHFIKNDDIISNK
jgi:hypothetical protein